MELFTISNQNEGDTMKIAVIGAGYVGLITALAFASIGHYVICIEKDQEKVQALNNGIAPIYEEGLEELLAHCLSEKRIQFTTHLDSAIADSSVIFVAVGTPSLDDGHVDLSQITAVYQQMSKSINNYKVIVNKSTVPVGTQKYAEDLLINLGVAKDDFDVVSNPEFLREGKALHDFFHGDRIVIGCHSPQARAIMEALYEPFDTIKVFTTPETAELVKYASNAFLATKISFINEIANFCNQVGVDVEMVSYALGLDQRIAPYFLKPGIGYGGSCLPKDTAALLKIGEAYGADFKIVQSAVEVNAKQRIMPVQILHEHYPSIQNQVISILGVTFKADTDDFREAPALYIIEELLKRGAIVKCYDPMVSGKIKEMFPTVLFYDYLYASLVDSICAIICTEWKEFSRLDLALLKEKMKEPLIIDGRNLLSLDTVRDYGIQYYSIGRGHFTD